MTTPPISHTILTTLAITSGVLSAQSATADDSAADLAKKLSNPIAALISVPLQNNSVCRGPGWRSRLGHPLRLHFSVSKKLTLANGKFVTKGLTQRQPASISLDNKW